MQVLSIMSILQRPRGTQSFSVSKLNSCFVKFVFRALGRGCISHVDGYLCEARLGKLECPHLGLSFIQFQTSYLWLSSAFSNFALWHQETCVHEAGVSQGLIHAHSDNCIQLHSVPRSKMVRERQGGKVR